MTRQLALAVCLAALLTACTTGAPEGDLSVVLVSPDSLRVDRLPPWNPEAPPAPNVERLAWRGTVYLNAWASSPWTAPSMVSIFTGLYPPSHGVAYRDDTTPRGLATLPRLLGEKGYRLGNFSFFSQVSYFRNLGLGSAVPDLSHDRVAESFEQWLGEQPPDQPFFAWVHLLETHLPYGATGYRATEVAVPGSTGLEKAQLRGTVPVGSAEFEDGDRERLLELYDRDVAAMDAALGRVLDALQSRGLEDRTLIVFVADHGEELLDDGWVGHASTSIAAKLIPQILRVPLIVAGPGVGAGRLRSSLVQPVDILPTLARWLDLDLPAEIDGRPLPGTGSFFERPRRLAFFDSSPGGNLTPLERRGERLQGLTDGRCLLEARSRPGTDDVRRLRPIVPGACDGREDELVTELDRWRTRQTEQRLALLSATPDETAPASEEVDGYDEVLEVLEPRSGQTLVRDETGGLITLAWTGDDKPYWIEYRLSGVAAPRGAFAVEQSRVVFGPVPEGFWNDVAAYSPIRIRIVDPAARRRSPWIEIEVAEAG